MVKRTVTTSIEAETYDNFKQCIGSKKINQALAEYMESVVEERKKVEALNISCLGASTMSTSNSNNKQQTILSYLNLINVEDFEQFDNRSIIKAQYHYVEGSKKLCQLKKQRRIIR